MDIRNLLLTVLSTILFASCLAGSPPQLSGSTETESDRLQALRISMVRSQIEARGIKDQAVLEAMRKIHRHLFVPSGMQELAYNDHPLPIGHDQTISQPYIVALMTEALQVEKGDRVLEIGTGSGYQAAVLGEIGAQVFTIEIVPALAERSAALLSKLGYRNIEVRSGDGYVGWEEEAPFDGIIVTAAPDHIPQPLLDQLAEGGRMIAPVGPQSSVQSLRLLTKVSGRIEEKDLGGVRFVPLTRRK